MTTAHKEWLENEYKMWIKALQESTVHNFKEHLMVQRMLGEVDLDLFLPLIKVKLPQEIIEKLDILNAIGWKDFRPPNVGMPTGAFARMVYYAQKVLETKPENIAEIGGGVGEFYAILRVLGYKGKYYIYDLPEVKEFQNRYLDYVSNIIKLSLIQEELEADITLVSFYALGEFDDNTKMYYYNEIIRYSQHGFIVWNPHSGASDTLEFFPEDCTEDDEYPLTSPGNKMLTW